MFIYPSFGSTSTCHVRLLGCTDQRFRWSSIHCGIYTYSFDCHMCKVNQNNYVMDGRTKMPPPSWGIIEPCAAPLRIRRGIPLAIWNPSNRSPIAVSGHTYAGCQKRCTRCGSPPLSSRYISHGVRQQPTIRKFLSRECIFWILHVLVAGTFSRINGWTAHVSDKTDYVCYFCFAFFIFFILPFTV